MSALVVLECNELRLRFVNDRGQFFADFQQRHSPEDQWYSFGIVRQLLTGEISGEELDGDAASYIFQHFNEISEIFSAARARDTERALVDLERQRGDRLFGPIT